MRILQRTIIALLTLVTSYGGFAAIASGDIAKFNEDYAEIQELISNGQLREASEGALAAVPLAKVVFDSDPENLANYYYLVAQLQAAQPWSGNMLKVLPIAEKAVAMASNLYGSNSDKALRARGFTLRILSYALTRTSAPKERKRLLSLLGVQKKDALKQVGKVETAAAADLYLSLSVSARTIRNAKKYSDAASQIFASIYGAQSKEAIQTRVAGTKFLSRSKQIKELSSILDSIGQDTNILLLKAGIHQKLAVLYLKSGKEDASMQHNITASEAFEFLGQAKSVVASDYLPILKANPKYPRRAQTRGVEGYVVLEYQVDEAGRAVDPIVIEAKPRGTFDKAAIEAAKLYRYLPKVKQGRPIAVSGVRTRITFEMVD